MSKKVKENVTLLCLRENDVAISMERNTIHNIMATKEELGI